MSIERGNNFWVEEELRLGTCAPRWSKEIIDGVRSEKSYGGDEMNDNVERDIGCNLLLAGPMVDGYLKEIGMVFLIKLARGNTAGLAPTVSMFIPWGIMKNLINLMKAYGCTTSMVQTHRKKQKLLIKITTMDTAKKIFDPSRFDGTNFLVKRMFHKVNEETTQKRRLAFNGSAEIVLTENTPVQFEYSHFTQYI